MLMSPRGQKSLFPRKHPKAANENHQGPGTDARFLVATIDSMGRYVSGQRMSNTAVSGWAGRTARMICDHLGMETD
jgi:hypothetical protein